MADTLARPLADLIPATGFGGMASVPEAPIAGRSVLIVDDSPQIRTIFTRHLEAQGFQVHAVADGAAALAAIAERSFDVILSDIDMPRMDGIRLLGEVRKHDLDVSIILITGGPSMETAIRALELGALHYLTKPVRFEALTESVENAVRVHQLAKAKRQALALAGGAERFTGDLAGLSASFDRALNHLRMVYQPIVAVSTKTIFAYEALMRSDEPTLSTPGDILHAGERLSRLIEIGRGVRAAAAMHMTLLPPDALLFVNLHPDDLLDDQLLCREGGLATIADRVVLEITERAPLDQIRDVRCRVAALRDIGYRMALDDFGAGYAGLTSFAILEPQVVKLDMGLVRNIHLEPTKRTLVATMVRMCTEMGTTVMAEGVETADERNALSGVGCELMQGFLFGRPQPPFAAASFPS